MSPRVPLLDLAAPGAARVVALGYLDEASRAYRRLGDPEDADALHDFRVALRRLHSCLRSFRALLDDSVRNRDRRRLRQLARATNRARDLEVHLTWLEAEQPALAETASIDIEWLIADVRARKAEAANELDDTVASAFPKLRKRLSRRLARYRVRLDRASGSFPRATMADVLGRSVAALRSEVAARLDVVDQVTDQEEAHRARVVAKRLRYLLEPLRDEIPRADRIVRQLRQLQDLLGDMHDVVVLAVDTSRRLGELAADEGERRQALEALLTHLRDRLELIFSEVRGWIDQRSAGLLADVDAVTARLLRRGGAAPSGLEIERKYLLAELPQLPEAGVEMMEVEQGWLPGERLQERVRRVRTWSGERYFRTVKEGTGMSRLEIEEEASAEVFAALWPLTAGRRVYKTRFAVPADGLVWEIDRFAGRDLVLAEVELPSPDAPVPVPGWLQRHIVREVTGDPAFLNVNLAG